MTFRGLVFLAWVLLGSTAHAQEDAYQAERHALCGGQEIPPALSASGGTRCDQIELYYGFEKKPDYAAARACAESGDQSAVPLLSGTGVLSMLYANGLGVRRDIDRAKILACQNEWISNDQIPVLMQRLEAMRHEPKAQLDLCDYASNTPTANICSYVATRWHAVHRAQRIQAYAPPSRPAALRQALNRLQKAEETFANSRAGNELNQMGTARAMMSDDELDRVGEQFVINLHDFSKATFPQAGAAEAAAADRELAETLDHIRKRGFSTEWQTIKVTGVEETQASWLQARQAWLDFAAVAWPKLSQDRVRWRLTRQRIRQLKGLERFAQ